MSEKTYLTPKELESRYEGHVTVNTLANWRSQGKGPPFTKIGGGVLYPMERLIAWENQNTVNSTLQYMRQEEISCSRTY